MFKSKSQKATEAQNKANKMKNKADKYQKYADKLYEKSLRPDSRFIAWIKRKVAEFKKSKIYNNIINDCVKYMSVCGVLSTIGFTLTRLIKASAIVTVVSNTLFGLSFIIELVVLIILMCKIIDDIDSHVEEMINND